MAIGSLDGTVTVGETLGIIALITPFHQALVDSLKLLGPRRRRYVEAINYVVSGGTAANAAGPSAELARSQQQVVESFALRALGDQEAWDVTDADIQNVVRIARMTAGRDVRATLEALDFLLATGVKDARAVAEVLSQIAVEPGDAKQRIDAWIAFLTPAHGAPPDRDGIPALVDTWKRRLIEEAVPGEIRARTDLPNALRAAEYRYHHDLTLWSLVIAVAEGILVAKYASTQTAAAGAGRILLAPSFAGLAAFGLLLLLPRATNSLLDAIIGLGDRFK